MAVNLNALAEVQTVGSNQNMLLFGDNNVATRIDYDKLAEAILNKTRSEIGGVSPISAIADLKGNTIPWTSYDGKLEVTLDDTSFSGISTFVKSLINGNTGKKWLTVRVNSSTSAPKVEPFYGASFALTINCSSANYGWGWMQSDNDINQLYYGRLGAGIWTWYKVGKQDDIDALNSRITNLRGNAYTGVTVTLLKEHSYIVIYARGIATGTCIYAIATSSDNTMLVDTIYEHADSTLTITNDGLNATFKGNRHGAVLLIDCGSLDW